MSPGKRPIGCYVSSVLSFFFTKKGGDRAKLALPSSNCTVRCYPAASFWWCFETCHPSSHVRPRERVDVQFTQRGDSEGDVRGAQRSWQWSDVLPVRLVDRSKSRGLALLSKPVSVCLEDSHPSHFI